MNPPPPRPDPADDPRLTAFLLGEEADAAPRAEMEALLRSSPAAAAWADDVRGLAAGLRLEFGNDALAAKPAAAPRRPAATTPADDRILLFPGRGGRWKAAALAAAAVVAAGFLTVWPMFLKAPPRRAPTPADGSRLVIEPLPDSAETALPSDAEPGASAGQFIPAASHPASTFVPSVGTDSLGLVRAALERGEMPPPETIRIEEMLNHFLPGDPTAAAGVRLDAAATPWNPAHMLVRVVFRAGPTATSGWQVRVEFNSNRVASWRLLGHESRRAGSPQAPEGEGGMIPAGRTVTTLYEVVPAARGDTMPVAPEWLTVHAAWRGRAAGQAVLPLSGVILPFAEADADFRFAAAVAAFGLALRDELTPAGGDRLTQLRAWARGDRGDRQTEFFRLVESARRIRAGRPKRAGRKTFGEGFFPLQLSLVHLTLRAPRFLYVPPLPPAPSRFKRFSSAWMAHCCRRLAGWGRKSGGADDDVRPVFANESRQSGHFGQQRAKPWWFGHAEHERGGRFPILRSRASP